MAAKKDKGGLEALRMDVQALADAFWKFQDTMLTNAAFDQVDQQVATASEVDANWIAPSDEQVQSASSLMAALSQPQRLQMTMLLADGPTKVTTLVSELGMKTTGAAYHHLNVLINNGIAVQPERGTFALTPNSANQVGQLLMALFGAPEAESKKSGKKKKKS